jgi:DNA-binding XRE family transcriptional regulator
MPATQTRFNAQLFDERCEALGATTESAKAALVEVDPATLWRVRKGEFNPRLAAALRFASTLGVTVEQLWPEAKS